ncbi:SCO family protein [Cytobacillus spongiae]|uniref:SCO family protein n=1 Tax=Cytobacillus spongiae TaxID=2901381 RepID=UPI001F2FFE1E|nr:SCO family protein [Cytobacillus spongiae]UII54504.1 SCO family protein [Cytobacillus spongiae]
MKLRFLATIAVIGVLLLAACGQKGIKDAKNWPVEDFSYQNQKGEAFGLKDLEGKVWVADFIFTSCEDVCLPMTSNMSKLQEMVKEEGIENIQFVSFTVDPTVDSPEKLKEFGDTFNVDYSNWNFLTGYSQEEITDFARESFKTLVVKPQNDDQVGHGTDFYLVGQDGKILKYYTGLAKIPFEDIIKDIKAVQ